MGGKFRAGLRALTQGFFLQGEPVGEDSRLPMPTATDALLDALLASDNIEYCAQLLAQLDEAQQENAELQSKVRAYSQKLTKAREEIARLRAQIEVAMAQRQETAVRASEYEHQLTVAKQAIERTKVTQARHLEEERRQWLAKLLPFITDVQLASSKVPRELAASPGFAPWYSGLQLVFRRLEQNLIKEWQLQPLASVGMGFNPHIHEAIHTEHSTDDKPEGTITKVVRQGYALGSHVLQPAQVCVAKQETTRPRQASPF